MVKWMSPAILAALACLSVAPAAAKDVSDVLYEVKGGVLAHDVSFLWSNFNRESGVDLNGELVFAPKWEILGGAIRPALGGSLNTAGDTSKIYLDAKYEYEFGNGFYAGIGLGGAWHDGNLRLTSNDRKALGSRILFHIPMEAGYRFDAHHGLSVYFDHVSNAYTQDANEGMDTLGVRYGYRF
jgi:lipid A 3-O-deacylase